MSPWPTANNFIKVIADEFQKVAREEIQVSPKLQLLALDLTEYGLEADAYLFYLECSEAKRASPSVSHICHAGYR